MQGKCGKVIFTRSISFNFTLKCVVINRDTIPSIGTKTPYTYGIQYFSIVFVPRKICLFLIILPTFPNFKTENAKKSRLILCAYVCTYPYDI